MKSLFRRALCILALTLLLPRPALAVHGVDLKLAKFSIETGLFNAILAKEVCSCMFVDGLTKDECLARDNLPAPVHRAVTVSEIVSPTEKSVTSRFKILVLATILAGVSPGPPAKAKFIDDKLGCVIQYGPVEAGVQVD